jgi:hypothetical protein
MILIILSLVAINFGVNDDSRNSIIEILKESESNEKLKNFLKVLLSWISELFSYLIIPSFETDFSKVPKENVSQFLEYLNLLAGNYESKRLERLRIKIEEAEKDKYDHEVRKAARISADEIAKIRKEKKQIDREKQIMCEENQRILRDQLRTIERKSIKATLESRLESEASLLKDKIKPDAKTRINSEQILDSVLKAITLIDEINRTEESREKKKKITKLNKEFNKSEKVVLINIFTTRYLNNYLK